VCNVFTGRGLVLSPTKAPRNEDSGMRKAIVKVSTRFRIQIPKAMREEMKIRPGQELFMYIYEGSLRLSPKRSIRELRGMAKGMKWRREYRDRADRF
jgi:AbrB family looped-hinge helix DNA binding protein